MVDKNEARQHLSGAIERLRVSSRSQLLEMLGDTQASEETGRSGAIYQLETQVFWDDESGGNLRVMVSIDDGGWRAFAPLSDDFIVAPDGSFVGE